MSLDSNGLSINHRDQQRLRPQLWEDQNSSTDEKNLYKRILDSIPAIVFVKDKNNQLLAFNKSFEEFMRFSREELLSKSAYELFPDAEKYHEDDLEVIETGRPKLNIIEEVIVPGDVVWLRTDKVPLKNDDNQIIGVLG